MLRWRVPRIVATLLAFAVLLALAACGGGRTLPAPVGSGQSPYPPPAPPEPVAPPSPGGSIGGPLKVALLVPLSGANAELGKSMLEAAQLALFTTAGNTLTLIPRDTGGTPQGAADAARSALTEGAKLIIGPLLAAEVEAVKPIAGEAKVNVIAFSTATQLAGGNLFLMGFLPRQEVVREVSFARERGLNRFAALVPNSPYGKLMSDALQEAAASGATVVKVERLSSGGSDAAAAIRQLLPAGAAAPPKPDEAVEPPPAPASKPGFDALLLPEGGAQLKALAHQLRAAGLDTSQVRLLGSGLWDDPSISGEPALYGGWFAASPPESRREFESRFSSTYGHPPPRLASLAFDAAALAAALAKGGEPFSREAILNPNGFTGIDGLFRFTAEGFVQRGLAVLEVEADGNTVVSPAPASFQNVGY